MSDEKKSRQSFSPASRWRIGFDVVLRTALVLAVVVMLNYLGAIFYHRFYLSAGTHTELSTRTLSVLHSMTNHVEVTLYYDREDEFYPQIKSLLDEYHAANKNITLHPVDYTRDPGEAEKVKERYNLPSTSDSPNGPPSKDLIIFDGGEGRFNYVPGDQVVQTKLEQIEPDDPSQTKPEYRHKPIAFNGEVLFTSKLMALEKAQPFKAYYLQGDNEASLADTSQYGYSQFGLTLAQNYILPVNLELLGNEQIPMDCNLLIIAGPAAQLSDVELQKIDKYLMDGGRLLVLFNYASVRQPTGLEPILQRWGVTVVPAFVKDLDNATDDLVVRKFGPHPVANPLAQLNLQIIRPRAVVKVTWQNPPANVPQVDELAFSGDNSILSSDPSAPPRSYPVMAAVEQKPSPGVTNPRGSTRIVVAGDSLFLANSVIGAGGNRDFVGYAVNWLLDRQELLAGIGPRPVAEFRLLLTDKQQRELRWLLLGALPGGVLILGWFVWLVRRK